MNLLPEDRIADIISRTTPRDACHLSLVSPIFRSATGSDVVWERFLPREYQSIISMFSHFLLPDLRPKKVLFRHLCEHPILSDDRKKSFSLDKQSGKICCMISSRDLIIVWGDTPTYWRWTSLPGARFQEVAELIDVCWLEIRGKISTRILSPGTNYTAYLVFKPTAGSYGFEDQPVEVSVGLVGTENQKRSVYLDASLAREDDGHHPNNRRDDWLGVELGDFYNAGDEDGELEMSILETTGGDWKGGLIIQGIEIRPKRGFNY